MQTAPLLRFTRIRHLLEEHTGFRPVETNRVPSRKLTPFVVDSVLPARGHAQVYGHFHLSSNAA